jgi:hypothetical protein
VHLMFFPKPSALHPEGMSPGAAGGGAQAGASGQSPHEHFSVSSQHVGSACAQGTISGGSPWSGPASSKSNCMGDPILYGILSFIVPIKLKNSCNKLRYPRKLYSTESSLSNIEPALQHEHE